MCYCINLIISFMTGYFVAILIDRAFSGFINDLFLHKSEIKAILLCTMF